MQGRFFFVIAHRMSAIGLADRIAVLEDGQLTAVAPLEKLITVSDSYRRMVELQTLGSLQQT